MKTLKAILSVAILAMPLLASGAEARSVTAAQLSAAGHGRRPMMTNRPSREIYHRNRAGRPHGFRHRARSGY